MKFFRVFVHMVNDTSQPFLVNAMVLGKPLAGS